MVLAGDSAGGGIAAAITQRLLEENQQQPRLQVLIYPWIQLQSNFSYINVHLYQHSVKSTFYLSTDFLPFTPMLKKFSYINFEISTFQLNQLFFNTPKSIYLYIYYSVISTCKIFLTFFYHVYAWLLNNIYVYNFFIDI